MRALFPVTCATKVGYTILSALAEGADRLVPERALSVLTDVDLHAVLPLKERDYQSDFQTEGSRREFSLTARAGCTPHAESARK